MNLYFDTSALVKFFHVETATEEVTKMINSKDNNIYISELAKLEFYSALHRRLRNNEIDIHSLKRAVKGFDVQILQFYVEPLTNTAVIEAGNLLKTFAADYGLRTLDALHLSTFKLISEENWYFVTSDKTLQKVVNALSFKAINPISV